MAQASQTIVVVGAIRSLGIEDPRRLDAVEHRGTAAVARAACRHGLRRITYITGSLVREDYGVRFPSTAPNWPPSG